MRGIKIDVVKKEIYPVIFINDFKDIYGYLDCRTFDVISTSYLAPGDVVYVDDEGLLRDEPIGAFSIKGVNQVLSGHGLILGGDEEGESVDHKTSLEHIKSIVRFEDTHYLPEPGFTIEIF